MKINKTTKKWADMVESIKFHDHKRHHDVHLANVIDHYGGIYKYSAERIATRYKNMPQDYALELATDVLGDVPLESNWMNLENYKK